MYMPFPTVKLPQEERFPAKRDALRRRIEKVLEELYPVPEGVDPELFARFVWFGLHL